MPFSTNIRIQRIRCKKCKKTTNVLPSFLLAYESYAVEVLKKLVNAYIASPESWHKFIDADIDLSTAYKWLRKLTQQAARSLPLIRKTLLELFPEYRVDALLTIEPPQLTSKPQLLKRFVLLSERLLKGAVRLADDKTALFKDSFCFVNYFLAQKTGKALLQL